MGSKPILDRLRALAEAHPGLQQFGQKRDSQVHNGKTACTHTVCQYLYLAWKGTLLSLDEVNELAGMPANPFNKEGKARGMRPEELKTFIRNTKLPMKIVFGRPFADILTASDMGPVFYGMRYGSAPKKSKSHKHGATQPGVDDMRHAVVMLGFEDGPGGPKVYRKDPNHGSPNRPERPPFDTLTAAEARKEYEDYRKIPPGFSLYAAVPTRSMSVIGSFVAPTVPRPRPLVVTNLVAFEGKAVAREPGHQAVQIADRETFDLVPGDAKDVVALGKLVPRLTGPPGDRTNVALVGDQAAIVLRADVDLFRADGTPEQFQPDPEALAATDDTDGEVAADIEVPSLVLVGLKAFDGTATVRGDLHGAVQIADRQFFRINDGGTKDVVATGQLVPRLPGPPGDRTNVVVVGDEAAIMLRADIELTDRQAHVTDRPDVDPAEDVPEEPDVDVPDGDDPTDADNDASNDPVEEDLDDAPAGASAPGPPQVPRRSSEPVGPSRTSQPNRPS